MVRKIHIGLPNHMLPINLWYNQKQTKRPYVLFGLSERDRCHLRAVISYFRMQRTLLS